MACSGSEDLIKIGKLSAGVNGFKSDVSKITLTQTELHTLRPILRSVNVDIKLRYLIRLKNIAPFCDPSNTTRG